MDGRRDDRAIVAALAAGDPWGLDQAYRRYAPRLLAYCVSLLRDGHAAADAVQDTFLLAAERAGQLRDPDRLPAWLFAIARHECLRQIRARDRHTALEEAGPLPADGAEPEPEAGLHAEHVRELVNAAATGLNTGDREIIELAIRHRLHLADVGAVMGLPSNHVHARLSRARTQLERAIGVLLMARHGRAACVTLDAELRHWDGSFDAKLRKRLGRHIDGCAACKAKRGQLISPSALLVAYGLLPLGGLARALMSTAPPGGEAGALPGSTLDQPVGTHGVGGSPAATGDPGTSTGAPGHPGTPSDSGALGHPGTPSDSGAPSHPGTPSDSGAPSHPGTSTGPGTPVTQGPGEVPLTPGSNDAPLVPGQGGPVSPITPGRPTLPIRPGRTTHRGPGPGHGPHRLRLDRKTGFPLQDNRKRRRARVLSLLLVLLAAACVAGPALLDRWRSPATLADSKADSKSGPGAGTGDGPGLPSPEHTGPPSPTTDATPTPPLIPSASPAGPETAQPKVIDPPRSPSPSPSLRIVVTHSALTCTGSIDFRLTVRVMSFSTMVYPRLYWRIQGGQAQSMAMTLTDRTHAYAVKQPLAGRSIEWWVQASTPDGVRGETTHAGATNPCLSAGPVLRA